MHLKNLGCEMVAKRLTVEQQQLCERYFAYAWRSATNLAAAWGRSRHVDEFQSCALLSLVEAAATYRPELGAFASHFGATFRRSARPLTRQLSYCGIVGNSSKGSGTAYKQPPISKTFDYEIAEHADGNVDETGLWEIEEAIESLPESRRERIRNAVNGRKVRDIATDRGVTTQAEFLQLKSARKALRAAMGETQCS